MEITYQLKQNKTKTTFESLPDRDVSLAEALNDFSLGDISHSFKSILNCRQKEEEDEIPNKLDEAISVIILRQHSISRTSLRPYFSIPQNCLLT